MKTAVGLMYRWVHMLKPAEAKRALLRHFIGLQLA